MEATIGFCCQQIDSARMAEIATALAEAPVEATTTFGRATHRIMDDSYGPTGKLRWAKHQLNLTAAELSQPYRDAVAELVAALPNGSKDVCQCAVALLAHQLKESYGVRKMATLASPSLYIIHAADLAALTPTDAATVTYIAGWLGFVMHRTANGRKSDREQLQARLLLGLRREAPTDAQPGAQPGARAVDSPQLMLPPPPPPPLQSLAADAGPGSAAIGDSGSDSEEDLDPELNEVDSASDGEGDSSESEEDSEDDSDSDEEVPPLPTAPVKPVLRVDVLVDRRWVLDFREFCEYVMWDVTGEFEAFVRLVEQCWAQMRYRAHDLDVGRAEIAIAAAPQVVALFGAAVGQACTMMMIPDDAGVDDSLVAEMRHSAVSRYINARIKGKLEKEREHYKLYKSTQMSTRSGVAGKKR